MRNKLFWAKHYEFTVQVNKIKQNKSKSSHHNQLQCDDRRHLKTSM